MSGERLREASILGDTKLVRSYIGGKDSGKAVSESNTILTPPSM
jgi:hypothetical protein